MAKQHSYPCYADSTTVKLGCSVLNSRIPIRRYNINTESDNLTAKYNVGVVNVVANLSVVNNKPIIHERRKTFRLHFCFRFQINSFGDGRFAKFANLNSNLTNLAKEHRNLINLFKSIIKSKF